MDGTLPSSADYEADAPGPGRFSQAHVSVPIRSPIEGGQEDPSLEPRRSGGEWSDGASSTPNSIHSDRRDRHRRRVIAPDVQIGPYAVIRRRCGAESVPGASIEAHGCLSGPLVMGRNESSWGTGQCWARARSIAATAGEPTGAGDRRRQRLPRVRTDPSRHRAGERGDARSATGTCSWSAATSATTCGSATAARW